MQPAGKSKCDGPVPRSASLHLTFPFPNGICACLHCVHHRSSFPTLDLHLHHLLSAHLDRLLSLCHCHCHFIANPPSQRSAPPVPATEPQSPNVCLLHLHRSYTPCNTPFAQRRHKPPLRGTIVYSPKEFYTALLPAPVPSLPIVNRSRSFAPCIFPSAVLQPTLLYSLQG